MSEEYSTLFYNFRQSNVLCKNLFTMLRGELISFTDIDDYIYPKHPNKDKDISKTTDNILWTSGKLISFYRNFTKLPKIILDDVAKKYKSELFESGKKFDFDSSIILINYINESVCNSVSELLEEIRFFGNCNRYDFDTRIRSNKNSTASEFNCAANLHSYNTIKIFEFLWNNIQGIKNKEIQKTKPQIIGKCSICSGNVVCYISEWKSIIPPAPKCIDCNAQMKYNVFPVIEMEQLAAFDA